MIPTPLENLIKDLAKLPGLGRRSAQRAALHLITEPTVMRKIQDALEEVSSKVITCEICGNMGLESPCHICSDSKRDQSLICVVEGVDDLWAIERIATFNGLYHVLGGVVSAINGVGMDDISIPQLVKRVERGSVRASKSGERDEIQARAQGFSEVILALGASVDGQTTSHLIARRIKPLGVKVSTLAQGMPVGAEVDYMDDGTLSIALQGRLEF